MIVDNISRNFDDFNVQSFVTTKQLLRVLDKRSKYKDELIRIFKIDETKNEIFKIGNADALINSLISLDNIIEKIDINAAIKDIHLKKMLELEKSTFEIFNISDDFILKQNKSDLLVAETLYSAKSDLLNLYNLSKFANYCRDKEYEDLIDTIKVYLKQKNIENNEEIGLRLLYKYDEEKFFIRAKTSSHVYKDFGINFSVFVALVSLSRYVDNSNNEIYIENYVVNDSEVYVSFSMTNVIKLDDNLSIGVSLILENDEIKRNAVTFNGVCKLKYSVNQKESEIYIKPKGIRKENLKYSVDLLTYPHKGSVEKVFEKIEELPKVIDLFINQVSDDAPKISALKNPDDVRKLIAGKIKYAKKAEFKEYKQKVYNKLMKITVDNTFKLFELLRDVEELFEHNDVVSRDFWRTKLYEALIEKK